MANYQRRLCLLVPVPEDPKGLKRFLDLKFRELDAHLSMMWSGMGSPEGVVDSPIGGFYLRMDGGAGTTLYIKESGTAKTGWVGK